MTADEFKASLKRLKLRQGWLADELGVDLSTVWRWKVGDLAVPKYASAYLRLYEALAAEGISLD